MATDVEILVDTSIHELEAVKRLCYSLGDRASIRLERIDESKLRAVCVPLGERELPPGFREGFERGLFDFGIRVSLARETAAVRDLIYRQAFVEADL